MIRTLLIATALSAGGGAAWLALDVSAKPVPERAVIVQQQSVAMEEILVASAVIPKGGKIGAAEVAWKAWPRDAVHEGFISRSAQPEAVSELDGWAARSELVAGEPVVREKLSPGGTGFLSAMLEPGTRAVAVRVSAENTAGGFVLPEDRVDVLHTTETTTRTILRNVKVLAIDQQGSDGNPEAVVIGKTATLELTPKQAELVVGAEASGMLSLALRPVTEVSEAQEVPLDPTPTPAAPVVKEPPEPRTVRVRRGSTSEVVVVR